MPLLKKSKPCLHTPAEKTLKEKLNWVIIQGMRCQKAFGSQKQFLKTTI